MEAGSGGYDLKVVDLSRPAPRPAATAVSFDRGPRRIALSPGGRLFAALSSSSLTLDDLATGRLLASVPLVTGFDDEVRLVFLPDGRLRVFAAVLERAMIGGGGGGDWRLIAYELDPARGRLTRVGGVTLAEDWGRWTLRGDGERVALNVRKGPVRLADIRTGTVLATLPCDSDLVTVTFLSDDRILLEERTLTATTLRLFDERGGELRRFPFPSQRLIVGGEVAPGRLAVATTERGTYAAAAGWTSFLLDLDSGHATPVGRDLFPAVRGGLPQSVGPRLFLESGVGLVLLDPATGRLRTVLRSPGS
jgi:hypothetical protein